MNNQPTYTPFKPGSYEVTICVFKKAEFLMDNVMLANTSLRFETVKEVSEWAERAKVNFE